MAGRGVLAIEIERSDFGNCGVDLNVLLVFNAAKFLLALSNGTCTISQAGELFPLEL